MEPQVWAVTAACLLLGAGFGWGIGRFLSRGLLVLIWITLAIGLAWCLYPALQNWMGRPHGGWDGVVRVAMAVMFVGPTFVASLLGGWLGLRQKARSQAE